ncbi:bifunctional 2-dehydro-3-deoxygluconokinase/2-dehydro-3-deoxygalactonokinase [Vulcanisaeta thermophila]|uniref:bifunctional 2-dehydro-3-deoxygluconokinase/2-dehydro-3- deoxygalactonokinase n=1 Tax=Vulcanisaeta thermophila TaxID=867917 RepID=UPI0008531067|nr:bifunctional 2-dehydro-3-deoxygluconokinase/2-dehydro-3-deoxygalactonokinase [Vulcanisaeta thermophila]
MPEVVALGEPLVQFNAVTTGPLRHVTYFEKHATGSEANVCVALVRLGVSCGLITRLGLDEFGLFIYNWLRGEGVDVSRIKFDPERPTGIYFVQRGYPLPGVSDVVYYRRGSAASALSPGDVDAEYIGGARVFHTSGITLAISESARDAAFRAMEVARSRNVLVSFDVNYRRKLWAREGDAVGVLTKALGFVDILFLDSDEARLLLGVSEPGDVFREVSARFGIGKVVLKLGVKGSIVYWDGKVARADAFRVPVVDPIGAGDAYAGVLLASVLRGLPIEQAVVRASAAAAMVVMTRGDEENLPREEDLERFLSGYGRQVDFR